MAYTISGVLAMPRADGTKVPLAQATLYAVPKASALRIQYGGVGAFVPLVANTTLPPPYQYGFVATTDDNGNYSFKLPAAGEIRPADPGWNIVVPGGVVYSGPAPTADASIDGLLQSQGWTQTQGLVVTAPLLGSYQRGVVSATNISSVTVYFAGSEMPAADYQVFLAPGWDTVLEQQVDGVVKPADRYVDRFVITFPTPFTGQVGWLAWK